MISKEDLISFLQYASLLLLFAFGVGCCAVLWAVLMGVLPEVQQ